MLSGSRAGRFWLWFEVRWRKQAIARFDAGTGEALVNERYRDFATIRTVISGLPTVRPEAFDASVSGIARNR